MNHYKYIVTFLFGFISTSLFSQDLSVQMKDFMTKISSAEYVYYKSTVTVEYAGGSALKQQLVYQKTPEAVYYKTDQMEMMADKDLSVMIYKESKVVMWQKPDAEKNILKDSKIILPDTILVKTDSIIYKGVQNGLHKYIVYNSKQYIEKMEFLFNASDGLLKQAVYYYNESINASVKKSTVNFDAFTINTTVSISHQWSSVLTYTNKKYSLSPAFSGYKLIPLDQNY